MPRTTIAFENGSGSTAFLLYCKTIEQNTKSIIITGFYPSSGEKP